MKLFRKLRKHASVPAWKIGLLQTAIVVAYILAGALIVTSPFAEEVGGVFRWFPPVGILAFLSTFVFSALVCSSAMLGYPALLCFDKKYRRATEIVLWSIAWLAIFLVGIGVIGVLSMGAQL